MRAGVWTENLLVAWHEQDGEIGGVACQTPPRGLLLGQIPAALIPSLAAELIDTERPLPGAGGPLPTAEAFAANWWRPENGRITQRLYRLDNLRTPSSPAPGRMRMPAPAELPLLTAWTIEFERESGHDDGGDPTPVVASRLTREELIWWETGTGEPVSFAGVSQPIAGMSRIGPVYTPPQHRGSGYGTAATYAATKLAMERGASEIVLFTDVSNPTSNRIYQSLGYQPVTDYAWITFA
ncbi:GNAT family N-acetyltransferase [Sinosporangium siamense]|nr:GNAT family N-acetyltransferase [Sinosporangium siamense]